eukprot:TRINITY_DN4561_c0_g1_i1.p1 TRINITY_DN4561_c0_g1~~TRINITY_DN4561_c0_g1_i1.p1  ORF type:complete len:489 (+),score=122.87 TRINITY_DN4561_c0_g1_i1:37-1467(+)
MATENNYATHISHFFTELSIARSDAEIGQVLQTFEEPLCNPVGEVREEDVAALYSGNGKSGLIFLCGDFTGIVRKDVKPFTVIAVRILYKLLRLPNPVFRKALYARSLQALRIIRFEKHIQSKKNPEQVLHALRIAEFLQRRMSREYLLSIFGGKKRALRHFTELLEAKKDDVESQITPLEAISAGFVYIQKEFGQGGDVVRARSPVQGEYGSNFDDTTSQVVSEGSGDSLSVSDEPTPVLYPVRPASPVATEVEPAATEDEPAITVIEHSDAESDMEYDDPALPTLAQLQKQELQQVIETQVHQPPAKRVLIVYELRNARDARPVLQREKQEAIRYERCQKGVAIFQNQIEELMELKVRAGDDEQTLEMIDDKINKSREHIATLTAKGKVQRLRSWEIQAEIDSNETRIAQLKHELTLCSAAMSHDVELSVVFEQVVARASQEQLKRICNRLRMSQLTVEELRGLLVNMQTSPTM